MNYLGHAYLSPRDEQLLIGNLAGDSVRRVDTAALPRNIQLGLDLHERIDVATDGESAFKDLCRCIDRADLPYPGVIADLLIDYVLASRWREFSDENFEAFKERVYLSLDRGAGLVSARFLFTATVLTAEDWFESYRSLEGMQTAFYRLSRRARRPIPLQEINRFLRREEDAILNCGSEILNNVAASIGSFL